MGAEPAARAGRRSGRRNFHTAAFEAFGPGEPDLICDGWTEVSRNLAAHLDATKAGPPWPIRASSCELREIQDYRAMQRLRDRVDAIVEDPQTAEALKPYYRFLCKRPCFNDEYLPAFNRPNVTLVDVSDTKGVERITAGGIVAHGVEYEVDCIIFASGFEITTELDRRLGIAPFAGRDGLSLYDHWADGYRTLHGITSHGFPNLLFTGFIQGGVTANTIEMFEQQARHIAYIVAAGAGPRRHDRGAHRRSPGRVGHDHPGHRDRQHQFPAGMHARLLQQRGRGADQVAPGRALRARFLRHGGPAPGLARLGRAEGPDPWLSSGSTTGWP